MAEKNGKGVSLDQVSKAASSMIAKGIQPSVRAVIAVTGGKTESVSRHLRDFNDKRNAEVLKMADELGSSAIARLLANEVQTVVDRKTDKLQIMVDELIVQRDEVIELLSEKEADCQHRVEMAEAKAVQVTNESAEKIRQANERADKAEQEANDARALSEEAKQNADAAINAAQTKCDLLINNAKSEAVALVEAADKRADKADQETVSLREQVKLLSIEQAKREIEQTQYQQTLDSFQQTQNELASERTRATKLEMQHENLAENMARLNEELTEIRGDSKQLGAMQGQFIELQKTLQQVKHDLSQSERERESLALALKSQS